MVVRVLLIHHIYQYSLYFMGKTLSCGVFFRGWGAVSDSCIKIKININFNFDTSLRCLKRFLRPYIKI